MFARPLLGIVVALGALAACGSSPSRRTDAGSARDGGPGTDADRTEPLDGAPLDGGPPPAPVDGGALDASGDDGGDPRFPLVWDRSRIESVQTVARTVGGVEMRAELYRNPAYRCGRTGYFTFVVVERASMAGSEAPLWAFLHGGGVGYYDASGSYHGGEEHNDEEDLLTLAGPLARAVDASGPLQNVLGRRLAEGWRFVMPSMCDHDLYAGIGHVYPHDPHWDGTDRVEGMLATMAAIHFTARGNGLSGTGALAGYPTTLVVVHGTSAGSAGAYHVSQGFERSGVRLNAAIMDAYVLTSRVPSLFLAGCTPQNQDPEWDLLATQQKIGPFATDPALWLETTMGSEHEVPLFDVVGSADPFCCGTGAPLSAATADGFDNNCRWIHDTVESAIAAHPGSRSRSLVVDGLGHVVTFDPGPHQDAIETWLAGVLAGAAPPVFP